MRICIISGSSRSSNNTLKVAKAIEKQLSSFHSVRLIDFQKFDLPMYNQVQMNDSNKTEFQQELFNALSESHIIIMASPEYNWTTTPELLQLCNVLSERNQLHCIQNKIFAFVGVSSGKGGKTPCIQLMQILNKIISFHKASSVVSSKIFESHFTKEVVDENGNLLQNEMYNKGLEEFLDYTCKIAERWFK